jgi:hypothetical protein
MQQAPGRSAREPLAFLSNAFASAALQYHAASACRADRDVLVISITLVCFTTLEGVS